MLISDFLVLQTMNFWPLPWCPVKDWINPLTWCFFPLGPYRTEVGHTADVSVVLPLTMKTAKHFEGCIPHVLQRVERCSLNTLYWQEHEE